MATPGSRSPTLVDTVVAAIALVAVQLEVWVWWVPSEQGPRPLAALLGLGMALPLVWRRSRPVESFIAVQAVHATWVLVSVPQGDLVPFLIELLALFSLAQATPPRAAFAGLCATVGIEVVFVARTTNDFADYMFILAFVAGAWGTGRAVRSRQRRADAAVRRRRCGSKSRRRSGRGRPSRPNERRIARELHDIVSHGGQRDGGAGCRRRAGLATDPPTRRASLKAVQEAGRDARLELRRMLGLMRSSAESPQLDPQPNLDQMDGLVRRSRRLDSEWICA